MKEKILNDLKESMKNQEKERLSVIRMIKGAMQMEELNLKRELKDNEIIGIIAKQIKTRKESIVEFEKGNRADLKEKTEREIKILETYMPEQLKEEEIDLQIEKAFQVISPKSQQDIGKIMGILTPLLKGKTDMGLVSQKVKEKLNLL